MADPKAAVSPPASILTSPKRPRGFLTLSPFTHPDLPGPDNLPGWFQQPKQPKRPELPIPIVTFPKILDRPAVNPVNLRELSVDARANLPPQLPPRSISLRVATSPKIVREATFGDVSPIQSKNHPPIASELFFYRLALCLDFEWI